MIQLFYSESVYKRYVASNSDALVTYNKKGLLGKELEF